MTDPISIIFLLLLIFLSGYCAASETALFSISQMKIQAYRSGKEPVKRAIAELLRRPRELLVTIFLINTLVNILIQNTMSSMAGPSAGMMLKVGAPFVVTLLFGEVIPKNIGFFQSEKLSLATVGSLRLLQSCIKPIRRLIVYVTGPISRVMFFFLKKEESISKDELRHILRTSEMRGVLEQDESKLVWGYLTLQDTLIKEAMRHKDEVLYYDVDQEPLTKLTHLFAELQVTRVPICHGGIDNVVGIISAHSYLVYRDKFISPASIIPFAKKPFFVPEGISAKLLLRQFNEQKQEIAMVVDEYGVITGLVTHEDLVEVVVGKIADSRDRKPLYTIASSSEIIASGKMELADLNDVFATTLVSSYNTVTVGGWLIEQLGEIPKSGTTYEFNNFFFQVLAADPHRIRRLYIRNGGEAK